MIAKWNTIIDKTIEDDGLYKVGHDVILMDCNMRIFLTPSHPMMDTRILYEEDILDFIIFNQIDKPIKLHRGDKISLQWKAFSDGANMVGDLLVELIEKEKG